jgi:hypothetical protein
MLKSTVDIVRTALKSDQTISAIHRARILEFLRNGANMQKPTAAGEARLIRRAEAARRLGCSLRLIDRLAKDGVLVKRRLPNRQRAAGFLETDVLALIAANPQTERGAEGEA